MALLNYFLHLGVLIGIYSILSVSLNFAVGFTGLLNLGHVAFFGIGAYVSALLAVGGFPIFGAVVCGALLAGVAGVLLALPSARLKGDYLALATLGFTFIIGSVARNAGFTSGALGIAGIPKIVKGSVWFLAVVFAVASLSYLFFWWLSRSRFGRACEAVRDDELAAKMLGLNAFAHKIAVMGVSAVFAGLAGALFAHYITFIDPTIFGVGDIILLLSLIIVGGLASIKGSFVGAVLLFGLLESLRFVSLPAAIVGPARDFLYALVLLLILLYRPRGLFGRVDLA